jgi:uncharacterized protein (TIGR03492 family)
MQLLCISNGHGEDAIATRILRCLPGEIAVSALPLTGDGSAYRDAGIPVIGPTRSLPSGGFIYMDGRQLARDIQGGLLSLTRAQCQSLNAWSHQGHAVLAVGDSIPLLFAWRSGLPYAFLGTAKSEYWLRDDYGQPLPGLGRFAGWSGSVYLPWERWLMGRPQCKAVFVRDPLTATWLQRLKLPAIWAGNPMMDGLSVTHSQLDPVFARFAEPPLTLVLLPGSRVPEAYANWESLLTAINGLVQQFRRRPLLLLVAMSPGLDRVPLERPLQQRGWRLEQAEPYLLYTERNATLALVSDAFAECLHRADVALAMAGTATEQFVGLGKPAITLPGSGPQFTQAFATVQQRLLGPAVILVEDPTQVATALQNLLQDPDRLQLIQSNGQQRMGPPGGSQQIADRLVKSLLTP